MFVELDRAQAEARGFETEYGQLELEQSTWGMPARVEKIAREQLRMQLPTPARTRDRRRCRARRRVRDEVRGGAAQRRRARDRCCRALRAPVVFGAFAAPVRLLWSRSVYLQWIDNEFLQTQGSARHSRELEVPAHRGRIVDRSGEALAVSTPVKSLWAFPDKFEATPEQLAQLARILETTPQRLQARLAKNEDFAFIAKQIPPETSERAMALRIKGLHDQNEYRRYYPGGEVTAHIVGFTGDHDAGQEGIELAQQAWLAGIPGSRRVIINRRSEAVEDVAAIRAPQAGRDLALPSTRGSNTSRSASSRPRSSSTRPRPAASSSSTCGPARSSRSRTGRRTTRTARDRAARDAMRNRALTDVFEPGSTLKPFTIAAALEAGKVRPDTLIQTAGRNADDRRATRSTTRIAGGPLTVEQVIQKSSNVGAAKIALGLPPETMWEMFSEVGLRHAAEDRLPRRSRRPAAARQIVEAHRAGDDGLRPRHLGQPRAARARLHDVRDRRRGEARDACSRPTGPSRVAPC